MKMFLRYVVVSLGRDIVLTWSRPFPMMVFPAVIYAFLCYSISLVITVAVNILNPFVLQAPPYNWSPQINGLINIPGILGNLIGAWAGGEPAEWNTTVSGSVLTEYRQSRGHLVQVANKEIARRLRAREPTLPGGHSTCDHNGRLPRVRLRCPERHVVGVALLRLRHDLRRADCHTNHHYGVCE